MASLKQLFFANVAQTTNFPLAIEMSSAEGIFIYGSDNKPYMDLISGISVSNLGHRHPKVTEAIHQQVDTHMHLLVYGEFVQHAQVKLAEKLTALLPKGMDNLYVVNSGAEAIDGALKLAKRYTGRSRIFSFNNAYHGSTHAALSIMGSEEYKRAYRPLLPDTYSLPYNDIDALQQIDEHTACVVAEVVQGEAGYIPGTDDFLKALRKRCDKVGALLIFDEIQTGFGRTGKLFAWEHSQVKPDIITMAKAMGGGMPIGAFAASSEIMGALKDNPILGHITTFGGHPVSCAAALANLEALLEEKWMETVTEKAALFKELLVHPNIFEVRGSGLMMAIQLDTFEHVQQVIAYCLQNGLITDWFLFNERALRIAPPLIITEEQIREACRILLEGIELIKK